MKHIVALQRAPGDDVEALVDRVRTTVTGGEQRFTALSIDVPIDDEELYDRLGRRPATRLPWDAVVLLWSSREIPIASAVDAFASNGMTAIGWEVDEHVVWPRRREWQEGERVPGVKQISFVAKPPALDESEFEARYRHHRTVAAEHHAHAWQYTQNVVRQSSSDDPAARYAGVSEMWFRTPSDLVERYYTTPESRQITYADTRHFIDSTTTTWALVTELCVFAAKPEHDAER